AGGAGGRRRPPPRRPSPPRPRPPSRAPPRAPRVSPHRMAEEEPLQSRMSLSEHLGELRSRLLRVVIAVVVLGAAGLVFARPIFVVLMKPVLDALPPSDPSLIDTSAIEQL